MIIKILFFTFRTMKGFSLKFLIPICLINIVSLFFKYFKKNNNFMQFSLDFLMFVLEIKWISVLLYTEKKPH